MSDWLSPNPPHIAEPFSVIKKKYDEIDIKNFSPRDIINDIQFL